MNFQRQMIATDTRKPDIGADVSQDVSESYAYLSPDHTTAFLRDDTHSFDDTNRNWGSASYGNTQDIGSDVSSVGSDNTVWKKELDKLLLLSRTLDKERQTKASAKSSTEFTKGSTPLDNTSSTAKGETSGIQDILHKPFTKDPSPHNGTTTIIPEKSTRGLRPKLAGSPPPLLYSHSTPLSKEHNNLKPHKWIPDSKDAVGDDSRNDETTFNDIFRPSSSSTKEAQKQHYAMKLDGQNDFKEFRDEDTFINHPFPQLAVPRVKNTHFQMPLANTRNNFQAPTQTNFQVPHQRPYQPTAHSERSISENRVSDTMHSSTSDAPEIKHVFEEFMRKVYPQVMEGVSKQIAESVSKIIPHFMEDSKIDNGAPQNFTLNEQEFRTPLGGVPSEATSEMGDDLSLDHSRNAVPEDRQEKDESPHTSPPQSQGFTKPTAESSDEISELKAQLRESEAEVFALKLTINTLEAKLSLQESSKGDGEENVHGISEEERRKQDEEYAEAKALKQENFKLRHKVNALESQLQELQNEIKWLTHQQSNPVDKDNIRGYEELRTKYEELSVHYKEDLDRVQALRVENSTLRQQLKEKVGNEELILTRNKVLEPFRKYYDKFQLDDVDKVLKVDLSNKFKRIMLTLLISKYDGFQEKCSKYARFIALSLQFIDKLHGHLYADSMTKPSHYVRDEEGLETLQKCLDGMIQVVGSK